MFSYSFATIMAVAALLSAPAQAAPTTANELTTTRSQQSHYELLKTIDWEDGQITFYGLAPGVVDPPLQKRQNCGDNAPTFCDNQNTSSRGGCENLYRWLNIFGDSPIGESPRRVCNEQGGQERCCTSWAQPAGNLYARDLINGVVTAFNTCGERISARVHNVILGGRCTIQCVSNRENGC